MKNLQAIFKYIKNYPGLVAAYFSFNILSVIFSVFSLAMLAPFLMLIFKLDGNVLDIVSDKGYNPIHEVKLYVSRMVEEPGGAEQALLMICIFIFIAILLKNAFAYLSLYYLNPIRNRILNDMRTNMYNKILLLPIGFFSDQRKGDVMSRFSNDLNDLEVSTISVLESLFREPITIIVYFSYLVILSPQLTLFLVLFLPVAGFILGRVGRSLKKKNQRVLQQFSNMFSTIEETLGGIRVIKAFNAERQVKQKFDEQSEAIYKLKNKANRRRDLASPLSEALGVTAVLCILFYGGRLILNNDAGLGLSAEDFITYIAFFSQLIPPLKGLSTASFNIQKGAASIERIEKLIQTHEEITDAPNAKVLETFEHSVEFRNVSFAYEDKVILKNINLVIPKGKTVALVGSSGAGKSTLADLVPRFIEATSGEVLIDGISVKDYTLQSVRSKMGIVTQEAILFNDTIARNIALGVDDASREAVEQAATIANAHTFILQKEHGYDTSVGERGSKLSGGERQRITIARAVMKNPPILILDEATSSLDTESERLVQEAIHQLMSHRTSLVIAHRLSTVRHADEIIVLQKGVIIERGTHDQLITQGGLYKKLIDMQEVQ